MQQTSLEAYFTVAQPKMGEHQIRVLAALRLIGTGCNQDLAEYLNWSINSVTPRILELREKGVVVQDRKDVHPITGRRVIYWKVKENK